MDAILNERFEVLETDVKTGSVREQLLIEFRNDATGEIDIIRGDQRTPYTLNRTELYGSGNVATVDPQNSTFMPLFLAIESEIANFDARRRRLTDAEVTLALDGLSMNPEASSADPLIQRLQCRLRIVLSLNNYSRQEVRQAIRKIGRSVVRHTDSGRAGIPQFHS